ncbi:MFS transporter [Dactylosporangium salmoneum]|uniref:Major facilitator superfamily (MFS) profile domain-containing protein n=1 Tax=Dactylosporangium salmoneum TaxID=53361 RepID=A0ABP5U453_9ACTN
MVATSRTVRRTYLTLVSLNALAVSFVWGINSLLMFQAGLSNTEALAANACFTLGYALFDVPTGTIADTWGRRVSYLLGGLTLFVTTLLYWLAWHVHAGVLVWAAVSLLLAAGFTCFSGATDAWLVDALHFLRWPGRLETVFARGQVCTGVGTLAGSLAGAWLAQLTDVGTPFLVRAGLVLALTVVAWRLMHDIGFTPRRAGPPLRAMRRVLDASIRDGWHRPAVRWVMLGACVAAGTGYFVAFVQKPYLLDLAGDRNAYGLLGVAAALTAAAQMVGGLLANRFQSLFRWRVSVLLAGVLLNAALLVALGVAGRLSVAMALLAGNSLASAGVLPSRQAYLNGLIPAGERATVLSFDSMVGSSGGVVLQPVLGRAADVWDYPAAFVLAGLLQLVALPLLLRARRYENGSLTAGPPPGTRTRRTPPPSCPPTPSRARE